MFTVAEAALLLHYPRITPCHSSLLQATTVKYSIAVCLKLLPTVVRGGIGTKPIRLWHRDRVSAQHHASLMAATLHCVHAKSGAYRPKSSIGRQVLSTKPSLSAWKIGSSKRKPIITPQGDVGPGDYTTEGGIGKQVNSKHRTAGAVSMKFRRNPPKSMTSVDVGELPTPFFLSQPS